MSAIAQENAPNTDYYPEYEVAEAIRLTEASQLFPGIEQHIDGFRADGQAILDAARHRLEAKAYDTVPLPIDVLSTARLLAKTKADQGESSPEFTEHLQALFSDSARLIDETERKNRWEHFPGIYQPLDQQTQDYSFNGVSLNQTVTSGISPIAEGYEQKIRVNDYVREQVNRLIGNSLLARRGISTLSINECPDEVIEAYKNNPLASYGNYAPEVEKFNIDEFIFDSRGRTYEQVALPGLYITHDIIVDALHEVEAIDLAHSPDKAQIREMPFVNSGQPILMRLVPLLDQKASERSQLNIFMGEVVASDHPKDYQAAIQEAAARRETHHEQALAVSDLLIDLEAKDTDSRLAEIVLSDFLKKKMFAESVSDPTKAAGIFNTATAEGIYQINCLLSIGQEEAAINLSESVYAQAPAPSFCGAGSCGLEGVSQFSRDAAEVKKLGLNTSQLLKDTVRSCRCGFKTIFYDLKTGDKACISCHRTETKNYKLS
jgi:hypothetical protein